MAFAKLKLVVRLVKINKSPDLIQMERALSIRNIDQIIQRIKQRNFMKQIAASNFFESMVQMKNFQKKKFKVALNILISTFVCNQRSKMIVAFLRIQGNFENFQKSNQCASTSISNPNENSPSNEDFKIDNDIIQNQVYISLREDFKLRRYPLCKLKN